MLTSIAEMAVSALHLTLEDCAQLAAGLQTSLSSDTDSDSASATVEVCCLSERESGNVNGAPIAMAIAPTRHPTC